jgi:hypothetical protein
LKSSVIVKILILLCFLTFVLPQKAQAEGFGDAALTVGITTGVGAVMGASTLPFYATPGEHTQNIFYGAALGAVTGVFLASMSAMKDNEQDMSFRDAPADTSHLAKSTAIRDVPVPILAQSPGAIYSQVTAFSF